MNSPPKLQSAGTVCLNLLVFAAVAWSVPPDVNEAHYLAKARHLWEPDWCSGDIFLESSAAHGLFFLGIGWVTTVFSLDATAWLGRLLTWLLLAWGWQRLAAAFELRPAMTCLAAAVFAMLLAWGHMAGEWVFGGVESKGFAYALVVFALEALVRGRWNRVWLLLGCAASLHVLVGGWSVAAALCAWMCSPQERPPLLKMLPALLAGLLLALPGLVPALAMNWQVSPEIKAEANQAYVFERLSHHLVFSRFPPFFVARHVGLLLLGSWIISCCHWHEPQRRLLRFAGGAVLIAAIGVAVDIATRSNPDFAASILRFYWFRLSDAIVPLTLALILASFHGQLNTDRPVAARLLLVGMLICSGAHVCQHSWERILDLRPPAIVQGMTAGDSQIDAAHRFRDWRLAGQWIAQHTPDGTIVLSPRHQQTLKWYAQRGEVVNWKDVPQDAVGIVEWRRRMNRVYPGSHAWRGLAFHGEAKLTELSAEFHFDYILLDRTRSQQPLSFERVYPPAGRQATYEVYRLPKEVSAEPEARGARQAATSAR